MRHRGRERWRARGREDRMQDAGRGKSGGVKGGIDRRREAGRGGGT